MHKLKVKSKLDNYLSMRSNFAVPYTATAPASPNHVSLTCKLHRGLRKSLVLHLS